MMEETRNKWTLSKEKIEWDAVETIPILLYIYIQITLPYCLYIKDV